VAYSLDPGRIFVNLKGREREGRIAPGPDYERVRDELIDAAERLTDPTTGARVVRKAYRREELYQGPALSEAADVVLAPENGFDPKGALAKASFTFKDQMMVGMHTFDDAFLYVGRSGLEDRPVNLLDIAPTMLSLLGIRPPAELDSLSLV